MAPCPASVPAGGRRRSTGDLGGGGERAGEEKSVERWRTVEETGTIEGSSRDRMGGGFHLKIPMGGFLELPPKILRVNPILFVTGLFVGRELVEVMAGIAFEAVFVVYPLWPQSSPQLRREALIGSKKGLRRSNVIGRHLVLDA
eukprot:761072-Hanusia_phi.AAC.4